MEKGELILKEKEIAVEKINEQIELEKKKKEAEELKIKKEKEVKILADQ